MLYELMSQEAIITDVPIIANMQKIKLFISTIHCSVKIFRVQ